MAEQMHSMLLIAWGEHLYVLQGKSPFFFMELGPANLGLLIEFLRAEVLKHKRWYQRFALRSDETLLHGTCMAVYKDADTIMLKRIVPMEGEPRDASFSLPVADFIRLMDEWCVIHTQRPPQILFTYEDGKVSIIPQYPANEHEAAA